MISFVPEPHLLGSVRGRDWPGLLPSPAFADSAVPPRSADVVIAGAGPAGLAVASALWHHGIRDVVLLDRDRPCGRFFGRIDLLRQRVLRSPYEHHPGVEGFRDCELLDFARMHWSLLSPVERNEIRMAQAGHRSVVPIDVFEAYCEHLVASHHIGERTWRQNVRDVLPSADSVSVRTDTTTVTARFAVLCMGESRREAPDGWWTGDGVRYWDQPMPPGAGRVIVIGAGLTAAHLVSNALADGAEVHWVIRETEERYQCADVNSKFFRPEGRARFDGVSWEDRLTLMGRFRRASIMFEFRPGFQRAEAEGRLIVHRGRAVKAVSSGVSVELEDGTRVGGDLALLALGTTPSTGSEVLPDEVINARDGWADLDERTLAYRLAPRVHAVGATAGMVLGPAARNIDGHRVATARVAAAVAAGLLDRPLVPDLAVSRG
ncbi:FAD binding domain-containing protein [Amycolatopsis xylanica]|uniref:FAD binding domain-containing protein n=1 Tax=Amycolatopsis xylanica TaxID=589385 RepID=A0A1H3D7R9_9PSEU|nr:FAD-dependent monooxygenase [Amycolatopsis xylanica]SDX62445.1 FAD binding domain-containing protein [Amycolatopsis xylanica]